MACGDGISCSALACSQAHAPKCPAACRTAPLVRHFFIQQWLKETVSRLTGRYSSWNSEDNSGSEYITKLEGPTQSSTDNCLDAREPLWAGILGFLHGRHSIFCRFSPFTADFLCLV